MTDPENAPAAPEQPPAAPSDVTCAACRSVISADGRSVIEKSAHLAKLEGAEAMLEEKKRELATLNEKLREIEAQIEAEAEPAAVPQADGDCTLEF